MMNFNHDNLDDSAHMLAWLHPTPIEEIKRLFISYVDRLAPEAYIQSLTVTSKPQWLTGGKRNPENANKVIVTRAGVAFCFAFHAAHHVGPSADVSGVFSWVGVDLDDAAHTEHQTWFDIHGSLEELGSEGRLSLRIYDVDAD